LFKVTCFFIFMLSSFFNPHNKIKTNIIIEYLSAAFPVHPPLSPRYPVIRRFSRWNPDYYHGYLGYCSGMLIISNLSQRQPMINMYVLAVLIKNPNVISKCDMYILYIYYTFKQSSGLQYFFGSALLYINTLPQTFMS